MQKEYNSTNIELIFPTDKTGTVLPISTQAQFPEWLFVSVPNATSFLTKQAWKHHRNHASHPSNYTLPKNKQYIYKLHTDCKKQERSLKWPVCMVAWLLCRAERRWTKQRDTQRADIIRWRVFSLPSSRLVTEWLLAEHSGLRNNCFHLLKVPGQCTCLYAHTHIPKHTHRAEVG